MVHFSPPTASPNHPFASALTCTSACAIVPGPRMSPRRAAHLIVSAFVRNSHRKKKLRMRQEQKEQLVGYAIHEQELRRPSSRNKDVRILPAALSTKIKTLKSGRFLACGRQFTYHIHQLNCFSLFVKMGKMQHVIWLYHLFSPEVYQEFGNDPDALLDYLKLVVQTLAQNLSSENLVEDLRQQIHLEI